MCDRVKDPVKWMAMIRFNQKNAKPPNRNAVFECETENEKQNQWLRRRRGRRGNSTNEAVENAPKKIKYKSTTRVMCLCFSLSIRFVFWQIYRTHAKWSNKICSISFFSPSLRHTHTHRLNFYAVAAAMAVCLMLNHISVRASHHLKVQRSINYSEEVIFCHSLCVSLEFLLFSLPRDGFLPLFSKSHWKVCGAEKKALEFCNTLIFLYCTIFSSC